MNIRCVISGGQTGADRGAITAAEASGIPVEGWAPKGFLTEAGPAPWLAGHGLKEHQSADYPPRTRANVGMAGGLIWFGNPHSPGGKLTLRLAQEANIDVYVVLTESTPQDVADWLAGMVLAGETEPVGIMVAGNRESKAPGIAARVDAFMREVFRLLAGERMARACRNPQCPRFVAKREEDLERTMPLCTREELAAAVAARDMQWWEALALVDNVAPNPEAVRQWVLTLRDHEIGGAVAAERAACVELAKRIAAEWEEDAEGKVKRRDFHGANLSNGHKGGAEEVAEAIQARGKS